MANIKDFAVGLVLTAPSPATSGTSLTLRSGEGASMPPVPFFATATPINQLSALDTSEKILVTARSGDTLTITRAQSPTTAKSIAVGWVIANAVYADDVLTSSLQMDQTLSGTANGTNKVFTTPQAFTSIQPFKNGVAMHLTSDFTITGANQITFVTAPASGASVTANIIVGTGITNANADQVDGFHASSTPTANTLLPLDSTGKIPVSVVRIGDVIGRDGDTYNPLPTTRVDITNSTQVFTLEQNATLLLTVTAKIQVNQNASADVLLSVDGSLAFRNIQNTITGTNQSIPTCSRTYRIPLAAGSHTIKLTSVATTINTCVAQEPSWFAYVMPGGGTL